MEDTAAATQSTRTDHADHEPVGLLTRYELLDEVGRGGMGVVYRGRHLLLDRPVAIKLHTLSGGADRFHREAKLLASVRSPYVVAVQDYEVLPNGQGMLVMAWVAGSDLARLIRAAGGPLPEARVVPWMRQVCEGMAAAAEQGIVHRDLKPANILIDEADTAYVADFGLARSASAADLTQTGGVMGTPLYMAPEQAEDPRGVDERADIYSFGATFYHALTGSPPFGGETWFSILLNHKTTPLVAPKARNPTLDDRLNHCLERCLAKSLHDRFQTFRELAEALRPDRSTSEDGEGDGGPEWDRYLSRRDQYLRGDASALPEPHHYHFPNGRHCRIEVGDLTEQVVEAVVSSEGINLTMRFGVSAALAAVAGDGYRELVGHFAPVRPGRVVVTPAGRLPARFVMHAVMSGSWDATWTAPSHDLVNEVMEATFYHADALGLRSIAYPLVGSGVAGLSRAVCLDTMFRFLVRKLSRGLTTLEDVRIILYDRTRR